MPVSVPGPARKAARYIRHTSRNARTRLLDPASLVEAERTPYEVIYEEDIVRVRYYPPLDVDHITVNGEQVTVQKQAHATPLVLVSPLAVNMYIYDLFEQRSLVKYLRARGFELYLIDWGRPDARHNHYTLSTYFADWMPRLLAQVRQHSGSQKLSLHGWSFGGLFSYAYTALGDPDIANLVLLGAPCDYHANGALGKQYRDGEVIVRQGEPGRAMYVIQEGTVDIVVERDGREVLLRTAGAGEIVGEMAIVDQEVRSATVRVKGEARILTVDKKTFLRRISEDPSLAFRVVEIMSRRIRELSGEVAALMTQVEALSPGGGGSSSGSQR